MSAPNHFAIVQGMANDYPQLLEENSYDSIREFMMMLAGRLVEEDPAWGYLTKDPGEKHIVLPDNQRVSVDSFIYRPTQQVVDMLTNAIDEGEAGPAWQEKEKRPNNNWWQITLRNSKQSEDSGGGDSGGDSQKDDEQDAKIASLEAQVADLASKLDAIAQNALQYGSSVSIKMARGLILCADNGGGDETMEPVTFSSRQSPPASDETFKLERGQ